MTTIGPALRVSGLTQMADLWTCGERRFAAGSSGIGFAANRPALTASSVLATTLRRRPPGSTALDLHAAADAPRRRNRSPLSSSTDRLNAGSGPGRWRPLTECSRAGSRAEVIVSASSRIHLPEVTATYRRRILDRIDWQEVRAALGLSERELQVVREIVSGSKLERIADELELALGTVKTYAARVREKLGVHDHGELLLAVLGAGLAPLDGDGQAKPPADSRQ